jgi:hypothetical protein
MIVKVGITTGDLRGDTNAVIQQAVDAAGSYGGGTVELGAGIYTLFNTVQLRRSVRLVGQGRDTVLRKCDGHHSGFAVDADYGQKKVTVENPSGFRVGMGLVVTDDRSDGWHTTVATVTLIKGNVIYLDKPFLSDYQIEAGGMAYSSFPLVAGIDVDSVAIEGLCLEGNREKNLPINGCVGGGIYLHRARRCRIADCLVRGFAGDGISFQVTQDIDVERCEVTRATGLGFHPGTGSVRAVVRDCKSIANGEDGIFLCWRVQESRFERNEVLDNGRHGFSIGHKDTDNLFLGNLVRGNKSHGILFREEKSSNAGSRNTFRRNVIEDNVGAGVFVGGDTTDLLFEENQIGDTRAGDERTQRVGIIAAPQTSRIRSCRDSFDNHIDAPAEGNVVLEGECVAER